MKLFFLSLASSYTEIFINFISKSKTGKMAPQKRHLLSVKSKDFSLITRTHIVEGEYMISQIVL